MWLDLDRVSVASLLKDALRLLARLQVENTEPSMAFVFGKPSPRRDHSIIAELVFSAFPRAEYVEVDLTGGADVVSVIAKWRLLRRRPAGTISASGEGAEHGIVWQKSRITTFMIRSQDDFQPTPSGSSSASR